MSTITIEKHRRGTPFEQIIRTRPKPRPVPPRAPTPVPPETEPHARPATPSRPHRQRMQALELANTVRSRRAQLKRDIKASREHISVLLLAPPAYIETMKVFDLMLAGPKYGRVKVNKVLSSCRISPSKTIGGLSERQRIELVDRMRRG